MGGLRVRRVRRVKQEIRHVVNFQSAVDDQLLYQERVFGDDGSATTWSNQLSQGGE